MAISKAEVRGGTIQRARVKGSPGQWCEDMELVQVGVRVPRWLAVWLRAQPESVGLILERGAEAFGAVPPAEVRACLRRRKRADESKIQRGIQTLTRANGEPGRFTPE